MPRARSLRLLGVRAGALVAGLLGVTSVRAEEPPAPVFPGHPWLSTYTKEVSLDGSAARLGDGKWVAAGGSSMAAFYTPWLSIQGAAQGALGLGGGRQTYDTRALLRFIWPQPVLSRLFFYGGIGVTVFFFEQTAQSDVFRRGLGPVGAVGVWAQLTDRMRLRAEVRDQWLVFGQTDLTHNVFATLSLATQYR